ncbi:hypothetical protein Esi_0037_0110 [Ectocarpus siliculosus]|uniref:Uncharacterized protein n=1 Tax=Ectocarpus siliculosus TaxID=2880 RepID=D8LLQ4_ECTSI|nr:hypothetical protein Esi_0037_0110 [Ectocarpus siliculosus]|eukprot:CBN74685.1 hypothetical protein Esi_0037_0110 [Ectocarpus siliculosus]
MTGLLLVTLPRPRPLRDTPGAAHRGRVHLRSSGRLAAEGDGSRRSRSTSPVPGSRRQRPKPLPFAAATAGGTAPGVQRSAASSRMATARGGGSRSYQRGIRLAALVLFLFTEPVRPKTKNIAELLLEDFWEGLPVESGTHTNVRMAAIYSRHDSRWMD